MQINILKNHQGLKISFSKQPMQKVPHTTKSPLETLFSHALWHLLHLTVGTGSLLDYLTHNEPYSTIIILTFRVDNPDVLL